MNDSRKATIAYDPVLLAAIFGLVGFGLVMVYSSSAITAQDKLGDGFFFLKRQAFGGGHRLRGHGAGDEARLPAHGAAGVPRCCVIAIDSAGGGAGARRGHGGRGRASRWLRVPGVSVQPAELAKLAWVIYLAYSLAKKQEKVKSFSIGFLPHLGVATLLVVLCMLEPDFGSAVALLFLMFVMLFAAGARLSYLVGLVLAAIPFAYAAIATSPYRMKRITAFLDPWANRQGSGYQVAESLMSIGSGGLTGLGLGEGRQKLYFLPEAHTDFIFAIVGEELGLVGVGLLVLLYAVVIWRGLRAALRATEAFGTYLGLGVTSLIAFQACVNMAVAMGLVPTKGLTLPFISYGGSSLVVLMGAAGLLLSVSTSATDGGRRRARVSKVTAAPVNAAGVPA
jgi:cell division protein FtsW